MIIRLITAILSCLIFAGVASGASEESAELPTEGDTAISIAKLKRSVVVTIGVRRIQQGVSTSDSASILARDCSWERAPCSLVADLRIEIDKNALFIPRSVYRGLANARSAKLMAIRGAYHLVIRGGDGSEGYVSTIIFDADRVSGRRLASSLAPNEILEETVYRRQKDLFDR